MPAMSLQLSRKSRSNPKIRTIIVAAIQATARLGVLFVIVDARLVSGEDHLHEGRCAEQRQGSEHNVRNPLYILLIPAEQQHRHSPAALSSGNNCKQRNRERAIVKTVCFAAKRFT
jgi:hypothetical protein